MSFKPPSPKQPSNRTGSVFAFPVNRCGNRRAFRLPGGERGSLLLYGGTLVRSYSVSILGISGPEGLRTLVYGGFNRKGRHDLSEDMGENLKYGRGPKISTIKSGTLPLLTYQKVTDRKKYPGCFLVEKLPLPFF